jgi:hypothetical protein
VLTSVELGGEVDRESAGDVQDDSETSDASIAAKTVGFTLVIPLTADRLGSSTTDRHHSSGDEAPLERPAHSFEWCATPRRSWEAQAVRIGTWNLDGKWTSRHEVALVDADCDVWLLTEIVEGAAIPGYTLSVCEARMSSAKEQHYAGILSRLPTRALPDPHPASAAARIGELTFCASVLPWRDPDDHLVWGYGDQGTRTTSAVRRLAISLSPRETVWGGDFNHPLKGSLRWTASVAGRQAIQALAATLEITMATASLPQRNPKDFSIDHIGVPSAWAVTEAIRVEVPAALSDHDAYVVAVVIN